MGQRFSKTPLSKAPSKDQKYNEAKPSPRPRESPTATIEANYSHLRSPHLLKQAGDQMAVTDQKIGFMAEHIPVPFSGSGSTPHSKQDSDETKAVNNEACDQDPKTSNIAPHSQEAKEIEEKIQSLRCKIANMNEDIDRLHEIKEVQRNKVVNLYSDAKTKEARSVQAVEDRIENDSDRTNAAYFLKLERSRVAKRRKQRDLMVIELKNLEDEVARMRGELAV